MRGEWRHCKKVAGIAAGRQEELLTAFAGGSGCLAKLVAIRTVRANFNNSEVDEILKLVKPEISKLRNVIREAIGVADTTADPLPYDGPNKAWCAAVSIGYAIEGDRGRGDLQFRRREDLTAEENMAT
jgi:hypothetical protein